jgi:hypothetical protein
VVEKVQACADKEQYAAHEDKEVHYAGIRLTQKPDMQGAVPDGLSYELADAPARLVKPFVGLAQSPHLIAPVHRKADQRNSNSCRQVEGYLYQQGDVPENFSRRFHVTPSEIIFLKPQYYITF